MRTNVKSHLFFHVSLARFSAKFHMFSDFLMMILDISEFKISKKIVNWVIQSRMEVFIRRAQLPAFLLCIGG
jgi:hypothetical protein